MKFFKSQPQNLCHLTFEQLDQFGLHPLVNIWNELWITVVMLSLEDFKALEETAYLLRTPTNAKRLLAAAAQLNASKGIKRTLAK